MTKDQFRIELIEFANELPGKIQESFFEDRDFKYHEYYILPVKYIRKTSIKKLDFHTLIYSLQPDPSILFDVHFHSKLLYGLHPLKTPEKKWLDIGSKGFAYAQRWNRTVYDLLSDSGTNKYKKEIQLFDEFFDQSHIDPNDYKSLIGDPEKSKKPKGKGGRPPDPNLKEKKQNLRKEYYKLTNEEGYKSSEAIKTLSKIYGWTKSTIETYLK
jgi:hypothetical protein